MFNWFRLWRIIITISLLEAEEETAVYSPQNMMSCFGHEDIDLNLYCAVFFNYIWKILNGQDKPSMQELKMSVKLCKDIKAKPVGVF